MELNVKMNNYIELDIVSDILSQTITKAKKKLQNEETQETKELLEKLLAYEKEVKKGNREVINKILQGEI